MINIEPHIRNVRPTGYAKVYIRINHRSDTTYIGTDYVVYGKQMSGKKIVDKYILSQISPIIKSYYDKLNKFKTDNWTLKEVMNLIKSDSEDISFTDFFKGFTNKMINAGRENPAQNYTCAINSLIRFCGKEKLNFSEITSKLINDWIESLKDTARAKKSLSFMHFYCILCWSFRA